MNLNARPKKIDCFCSFVPCSNSSEYYQTNFSSVFTLSRQNKNIEKKLLLKRESKGTKFESKLIGIRTIFIDGNVNLLTNIQTHNCCIYTKSKSNVYFERTPVSELGIQHNFPNQYVQHFYIFFVFRSLGAFGPFHFEIKPQ